MENKKDQYKNAYGLWFVTTEGDVEGRTVKNLGTFEGYFDEIAFHLADKQYYSLCFKKVEKVEKYTPSKKDVTICFDIDSGTWEMTPDELINYFKMILSDNMRGDIRVSNGSSYASVNMSLDTFDKNEVLKRRAMAKLTEEEIAALGLNN